MHYEHNHSPTVRGLPELCEVVCRAGLRRFTSVPGEIPVFLLHARYGGCDMTQAQVNQA